MGEMGKILGIVCLLLACANIAVAKQYVIDGDTIVIDDKTYRINGIDAPEAGQKCKSERGKDWGCGDAATNALYELTHRKRVRCEEIVVDVYSRTVARCFVGNVDLGLAMVERGMAWAFVKFSDEYEPAQNKAKDAKIGIWRGPSTPAWEFRADRWAAAQSDAPEGCAIKGNISARGKIYHTPWSPWYKRTGINEAKGERWFCDEAGAIKAGWRAARWK
jgi:endonuclease YncB( thermonuclease family)